VPDGVADKGEGVAGEGDGVAGEGAGDCAVAAAAPSAAHKMMPEKKKRKSLPLTLTLSPLARGEGMCFLS
jgi:hypothetical protein